MIRFLFKTHAAVWIATVTLLLSGRPAQGQDEVAAAKALYLAASYDEALATLDRLPASERDRSVDALQVRAFALLALQRSDEARAVIEQIYARDPLFRVDGTQASPRIQAVFHDVRVAVLPGAVQRTYAKARDLFEHKDPKAIAMFERVLTLLDDPDMEGHAVPDFRTVVAGFLDLSRLSLSAPAPAPRHDAAATPVPSPPAAAAPPAAPEPAIVVPPVAVTRSLPPWDPPAGPSRLLVFEGELEVSIDEHGDVTAASLPEPIHPAYDQQLLRAARQWKFTPATFNGAPVAFVLTMPIRLQAP
jgi:TonB family protein